jgi:hypothetical protein
MLILITCTLFLGIILICVGNLKKWDQNEIQNNSFNISLFCFFLSIFLWIFFDRSCSKYQYTLDCFLNLNETNLNNYLYVIVESTNFFFNFFFSSIYFTKFFISFGLDGISLFFILLSTFTIPLCLLTSYTKNFTNKSGYCLYFLSLELFLVLSFASTNLIVFFWECVNTDVFSYWRLRIKGAKNKSFFFFLFIYIIWIYFFIFFYVDYILWFWYFEF